MKNKLTVLVAILFIISGLGLLFLIFSPVLKEEAKYYLSYQNDQTKPWELVDDPDNATASSQPLVETVGWHPVRITPVSFDFSLVIPDIGVNAPVFANIDSGDADIYEPVLKKGVAHALYSAMPDEAGTVFIFAHSTNSFLNLSRYNAVFYLINKLKAGDEIFIFYKQHKYSYRVDETRVVSADSVGKEVVSLNGNNLVLQTCWPPGTTLKRMIVVAKRVI